jgi:uncharacterized protein YkvS
MWYNFPVPYKGLIQSCPRIHGFSIRGLSPPENKKDLKIKEKTVHNFQNAR